MLKYIDTDANIEVFVCEKCGVEHFKENEVFINEDGDEVCSDCYAIVFYSEPAWAM